MYKNINFLVPSRAKGKGNVCPYYDRIKEEFAEATSDRQEKEERQK